MAGADVSLIYDDCPDDLTDEGFEQGDCSSPRTPGDDPSLSPLLRIQKYAQSGDIFDRHMVPRVVQGIFRTAPPDILTKELPDIMRVLTKIGDESLLRADLLENIPNIAAQAVESSTRVAALSDVVGDYLIPLVVRNLGCSDTGADKAAQVTLIQLIERGFVSKFQAEIKICPSILALTKMESQLDVNTGAVTLMSKLAPLLGIDITERILLKRFTELCSSHMFYVRKLSASHFGHYCLVVGKRAFEKTLLPCFLTLCQDEIWGVRKSCAEVIMFLSCMCVPKLRASLLAPAFLKLLQDECRWVKMSAFQTLGAFISTFACPPLTSIGYNSSGELVMFNRDGNEFHPGGTEGFMNPAPISTKEELPYFSLAETYFDEVAVAREILGDVTGKGEPSQNMTGIDTLEELGADEPQVNLETDIIAAKQGPDDQSAIEKVVVDSKETLEIEKTPFVQETPDSLITRQINANLGKNVDNSENITIKDQLPTVRISDTTKEEQVTALHDNKSECSISQHEDDLLSYNQYNYWYISPPDVELDGLIETRDFAQSVDQSGCTSLDIMTSHLEDLYATISLNDSIDDGQNKSIVPSSDNKGDKLDIKNSNVNLNVHNTDSIEPKEPPQKIVPQELIDNFVSMAHYERSFEDVDYSFHCAYALPAVILTLGKENWGLLKDTLHVLAGHMSYKIRRTIASSLHEIAAILGPDIATEDLSPLFEGFLKDLDEVRIGILKHLAEFLQLITPEKRVMFLPKMGEFLRVDNVCNWRFQETLAEQLTLAVNLFRPADIVKHIGLYAQGLMLYNVAAVRQAAMLLVTEIVKHITKDHGLAALPSSYLSVIAERFAHSKKWKPRQTFASLCAELLKQNALSPEEFASVMLPHLLDLSWDPVANVRLVVAKCIVNHIITNEYFLDPTNEQLESLDNVLRRLQSDKDRDVRMSAEYPLIYH